MPAIATIALEVDGETGIGATPELLGSPSSSLSNGVEYLIIAMGHARNPTGGNIVSTLDLRVGGVVHARSGGSMGFPNPGYGALNGFQLGAAFTYTAGASDEMEFYSSDADSTGAATSCRAYALAMTDIANDVDRFHEETANSDTIVTTPTSGWTDVGNVLTFTAPRTGFALIIASCEAVVDADAATGDEFGIRLTQDGAEVLGSLCAMDVDPSDDDQVLNHCVARVVPVTASTEYDFALQGNGTVANGNVGFRRVRLHAIMVDRIEDADCTQDVDAVGLSLTAGTEDEADLLVTVNPPASRDYLLMGNFQGMFAAWSRAFFLQDGTTVTPTDGCANSSGDSDNGTEVDRALVHTWMLSRVTGISTETDFTIRFGSFAGGATNDYGAAAARDDGAIYAIALRLYTAESDTVLTPAAERLRINSAAPTLVLGAVTASPSVERLRIQSAAPSLLLALTLAPASQRLRFNEAEEALVLGAISLAPASQRMRIQTGVPSVLTNFVFAPASERLRFVEGSPTRVLGGVVLTPASQRLRFRTGAVMGATFEVGDLTVETGGSMEVFVNPTPTFGVVLDVD